MPRVLGNKQQLVCSDNVFLEPNEGSGISLSPTEGPGDQCLCAVTLPQEDDGLVTGT